PYTTLFRSGKLMNKYYDKSTFKALVSIYPHISWNIRRFHPDFPKIQKYFLEVEKELEILELEDWYGVTKNHIKAIDKVIDLFDGIIWSNFKREGSCYHFTVIL